ncbi:hypothetical protein [Methanococcoides sp. FTZ1]|uniref:hypothetical protein n=1 Tax=Methanococcoides sp. FTZ1 TaxID=3439061 RepID=UPI003F837346
MYEKDDSLQDGIKLLFRRFIYGLFILMALGPIIKYFTNYAQTVEGDHFMGAIPLVLIGLDFINFIAIAGIGTALFYFYYNAVHKRKYGDEETEMYYQEQYR